MIAWVHDVISSVNASASQLFTLQKQPTIQVLSILTLLYARTNKVVFYNEMYNIKTRPFTTKQLHIETIQ